MVFQAASAKRIFCQWQQPIYAKPSKLPFFSQQQQQQPTLLPLKDLRLSSLTGARSNHPLSALYDLSSSADLPFVVSDVSKPLLVLRVDHKLHDTDPTSCPWDRIVFSRVAVSRSFCDLIGFTEVGFIFFNFYLFFGCCFICSFFYYVFVSSIQCVFIFYFVYCFFYLSFKLIPFFYLGRINFRSEHRDILS